MNPPQGANSPEQIPVNSDDNNESSFLKATPRPWIISYSPCDKTICIYDREGVEPICEMSSAFSMIETDANAGLIVAAVNAYSPTEHAQLVARVASLEGGAESCWRSLASTVLAVQIRLGATPQEAERVAENHPAVKEARALLSPVPQEGQKAPANPERG